MATVRLRPVLGWNEDQQRPKNLARPLRFGCSSSRPASLCRPISILFQENDQDVIRTIPYQRLSSFGAFHNDFMLTVDRSEASPEEAVKERVTFSMEKIQVETVSDVMHLVRLNFQLTQHLAEYIRCQKLVWKVSK